MFGERMVLLGPEDGPKGGGDNTQASKTGRVPIVQQMFPNSMNSSGAPVEGQHLIPSMEEGFAQVPVEAEEVEAARMVERAGAGSRSGTAGGGSGVVQREARMDEEAKGGNKSIFQAEGIIEPQPLPSETALRNEANANILQAKRATAAAELQAMGLSEQYMAQYANVGAQDAIEGQRLHDDHFTKAKGRMDNLYRDVQSAQSLKVNPFNWHNSIGRGGRVASAFSLLTGQMAAGAGNPNSALKMMDSAIERDISAQEQNIKNEYTNLKLQGQLGQDARAMHEEEIAGLGKIRALKYSAILGRIGAAKQHAITEGAYQAYNVMEEHYIIKQLDALQAERARILSVHVKGPIRASMLRQIQQQVMTMQKQLTPGQDITPGGGQAPVEQSATAGPTTQGSAPGRAGSVAARRAPKASTPTPPTSGGSSPEAPSEAASSSSNTESFLESSLGADANVTASAPDPFNAPDHPVPTPEETRASMLNNIGGATPAQRKRAERIASADGFALDDANFNGFPTTNIAGVYESLEAYSAGANKLPKGGFSDDRDAQLFADELRSRPPLRKNYKTAEGHKAALASHAFQVDNYEVFEQPGVQNTIDLGGGRYWRVKRISPARRTDAQGTAKYYEMVNKLKEGQDYVDKLFRVAKDYQRVGPGGGFFNDKEGWFSIPGINSTDPGTKDMEQNITRLAMGFIKSEDPTARLSDKDLEVGEAAMGLRDNGKINMPLLLDRLQSLFPGKYSENTVRRHMVRYLQGVAVAAQAAYYQKFSNDLVPDYTTDKLMVEQSDNFQAWLNKDLEDHPQ